MTAGMLLYNIMIIRGSNTQLHMSTNPLVELKPGRESFAVLILEPKEPDLSQPNCLDDLHSGRKYMHMGTSH